MNDDHKDEFLLRLKKSELYNALTTQCAEKDSEVIALVDSAVSYAFQRTKTIVAHMGEYTLHDGDHLFRVLNLMERLLTTPNTQNLSTPELMLLILSAFFHDIGMAPDEKEVLAWKKIWDATPKIEDDTEQEMFDDFKRFYSSQPETQSTIERLIIEGKHSTASIMKSYLISEFIRKTHAERARRIIDQHWNEKIVYRETDLTVELANICFSHNDDALKLMDLDGSYPCGNGTYVCLPLIGVILRLSDILDFDAKRTPKVLYSHLHVRHPISIKEWEKHRAIENWEITPDLIQFSAQCKHPTIEASIHEFCNLIDHELSTCNNVISYFNQHNESKSREIRIKVPFKVNRSKIQTKKDIYNNPIYTYKNTKFNLSKRQVVELLMGTELYGNPEVALRELLQNSIDACLLRKAQEQKWGNLYTPAITIKYYSIDGDDILEVEDNGTGMDQSIIDNYYSKIGSSFYKSPDFYSLKAQSNADFTPTSRFGIGILSCFMVADSLIVDTRRVYAPHSSSDPINVMIEGQESIFWIKAGSRETPGTNTKLILRKAENPWMKMSEKAFIDSVENIVPNPPFTINIETSHEKRTRNEDSFKLINASSLKDYTWRDDENIKTIEIQIDNNHNGIVGSAIVALIERDGHPEEAIELTSKDIEIDGEIFTLEKKLAIADNRIEQSSMSITINDEGEISSDDSTTTFAKSKSRISLHGIEIPTSLFPDYWRLKNNQVSLSWPFPILIVIDVCGNRDLDLNSPRTEILMSDKWIDFEEQLAMDVCFNIMQVVGGEYWAELKATLNILSSNEVFLRGMNRV